MGDLPKNYNGWCAGGGTFQLSGRDAASGYMACPNCERAVKLTRRRNPPGWMVPHHYAARAGQKYRTP